MIRRAVSRGLWAVGLSLAAQSSQLIAQSSRLRSPYAGIETRVLPNGLTVWFKRVPGAGTFSASVAVPYGSDEDPPGLEQLAHFTEHMLFTDQPGRTESEIKREIEDRGGTRNGFTYDDHQLYFVRIGREHALRAVEWLSRLVAPHAMDPAVVERQRTPVAIEVRARPRELLERLALWYADPPGLALPGFWEREFGIRAWRLREYDPYRSVRAIGPEDLRAFYRRYYAPSRMTLLLVGDAAPDSLWPLVARTFGVLPARPTPPPRPALVDPRRERREFGWEPRSNTLYEERYKLYAPSAADRLRLLLVARLLSRRLDDALRYGERKAVYGVSVRARRRGDAVQLAIASGIRPDLLGVARARIDAEVARLRDGALTEAEFARERDAVVSALRVQGATVEGIAAWLDDAFYDPALFPDYPDLVSVFSGMTRDEVVAFARRTLVPERRVLAVTRRPPARLELLLALGAIVAWLAARLTGRRLARRLDLTRLRYVARLRAPPPWRLLAGAAYAAVVLTALRLVVFAYQLVYDRVLVGVDSFWTQAAAAAAGLALLAALAVVALAAVPRKVLVLEHGVAIKALAYRSTWLAWDDLASVSRATLPALVRRDGWRSSGGLRPLVPALLAPALHLRAADGRAWLLRSRDTDELHRVIERLRAPDHPAPRGDAGAEEPATISSPFSTASAPPREPVVI